MAGLDSLTIHETTPTLTLLSLPFEIRSLIYRFVLNFASSNTDNSVTNSQKPHPLALLSTCRQIHSEARLLLFQLNIFPVLLSHRCFTCFHSNVRAALAILNKLRSWQINAIRRLDLQLTGLISDVQAAELVLWIMRSGEPMDTEMWTVVQKDENGNDTPSEVVITTPYQGSLQSISLEISTSYNLLPAGETQTKLRHVLGLEPTPSSIFGFSSSASASTSSTSSSSSSCSTSPISTTTIDKKIPSPPTIWDVPTLRHVRVVVQTSGSGSSAFNPTIITKAEEDAFKVGLSGRLKQITDEIRNRDGDEMELEIEFPMSKSSLSVSVRCWGIKMPLVI